ncbi:MAG: hypothetical protein KU28_06440 [Sulfurovum sp. PC08-66]|jgi:outer membrane protein assembly factor BamB|nr:MAG: hypothetical protein KU28_06440 [Sulfurovum sp. PC08-66]
MKKILFLGVTSLAFILLPSCNSKKYFEPEKSSEMRTKTQTLGSKITFVNRDGATLSSGEYINKQGSGMVNLGKAYRYINESSQYILAANTTGNLKIIDKTTQKSKVVIGLQVPVVSANVSGDIVVYLLEDNSYGIYKISNNLKLWESKSESVFAIDNRVANPIFADGSIVLPTLDGKLLMLNPNNKEATKTIYISAQNNFNNAIFLSKVGNRLIAASAHSVLVVTGGSEKRMRVKLSDIVVTNSAIYLFAKNGEIIKSDFDLNKKASVKFDYALYSVVGAYGDKLYALDFKGALIVLNSSLTQHKIYNFEDVDSYTFISNNRLFKNKEVIKIDALSYE